MAKTYGRHMRMAPKTTKTKQKTEKHGTNNNGGGASANIASTTTTTLETGVPDLLRNVGEFPETFL